MDIIDLGPCEIAKGGSVGYSSSDPSSYVSYFTSLEEKQKFITVQVEAQKESTERGFPMIKDFDKALEYWNKVPVLEDIKVKNTVDIFAVDYPLQSGKYLPNNKTSDNYSDLVKKHADFFFVAYSDRLLWADFCILSMMRNAQNNYKIDDYVKLRYLDDGTPVFDFSVIAGLFITDSVDVNQPIFLNTNMYGENSTNWARLDISKDGTLFDPNGLNLNTTQFVRGLGFDVLHSNDWLYVPGIVQSSIGLNEIHEIHYTDINGNKKTVYPKNKNSRTSGAQVVGGEINRMADWLIDDEQILKPQSQFMNNWEYNLDMFAAMNIELSLPNYIKNSTLATQSALKISDIKTVFNSLTVDNRIALQTDLKRLGLYDWETNGASWELTKSAFEQLFVYLDSYYPERKYIADYGFDESGISDQEFINFWRDLYGCGEDNLLKITSVCGN
jgi:hypothetical protein